MPTITSSIQHCTGDPSQYSKTRKKLHKIERRNKFLLFLDDRIIHVKSTSNCTNKLLKIRAYMTVIGYKLKIEKAIAFLDLTINQLKNERKKMLLH